MNIIKKSWQINENLVTPKELFEKRRNFIKLECCYFLFQVVQ